MEQHLNNPENEFLWALLANEANDAHLNIYNLQRLVNDFPQSGILQALFAQASDEKNLKRAAVYFNPQSLFKLINAPSALTGVPAERIVIQPGLGAKGDYRNDELPASGETISHGPADEHEAGMFLDNPVVAGDAIAGNDEPADGAAHKTEQLQLVDETNAGEHAEIVTETPVEETTQPQPETPAAEIETGEPTDIAAEIADEEIIKPEIETPAAEIEAVEHEEIATETPVEETTQPEMPFAEIETGEHIDIAAEIADEKIIKPEIETPAAEIEAVEHDEIVTETPVEETTQPETPFTEIEIGQDAEIAAEAPVEETAQSSHETEAGGGNNEIYDETVGIADINFKNQEAGSNLIPFDEEFGAHTENESEAAVGATQAGLTEKGKLQGDTGQQEVSKYHDEKMPYTFMWWLDKTRKEHARADQPYIKSSETALNKKADGAADELQQQYFENIFHITPVEELDKGRAPTKAPYNNKRKEQVIIERFIMEEPQIKPQSSDKLDNENKAKKSSEDRDELVTETLAVIYSDQMLYHKAISSYRKLMLKFPEKSSYFAGKIEQLEKKTN